MINIEGRYFPDEYAEYKGCSNCQHQPAPLMMCGRKFTYIEPICTMWELRKKDNAEPTEE